ncbi:hypothetical protein HPP92_014232 [Vanilla planifolia]|uniref:Uncharacterized protein n=1 Tax=Vanilla planifolia TaxID=51239 RepID=A0A835USY8_VANPL|nr:hypothetical protein HPP92_014694 [Vanilla planifolia]KAG0474546.1 hypothetical protein HPP92_014232 [Vanilla planifolia]
MSPKKSEEAFNKLVLSSSLATTQAAFPGSSSCSSTSTLYNEISVEQADPTLSLNLKSSDSEKSVASFLNLSLPLCPPQTSTSSPPAINNDLELSIAPPQSHSSLAVIFRHH